MTDAQARQYFGWTSQSTMLGRYAHLTDADTHHALLRENQLNVAPPKPYVLAVRSCARCQTVNVPTATFCVTCTLPLDAMGVYAAPSSEELALRLAKILLDGGLVNEAVAAIHQGNLGETLARLAGVKDDDSNIG